MPKSVYFKYDFSAARVNQYVVSAAAVTAQVVAVADKNKRGVFCWVGCNGCERCRDQNRRRYQTTTRAPFDTFEGLD